MADFEGGMLRPIPVAATIPFTPSGTIEATNTQAAIEELAVEQTGILPLAQLLVATQMGAL